MAGPFSFIFREKGVEMDFVYLVCCDWWDDILRISEHYEVKGIFSTKEQARECLFSIVDCHKDRWNSRGTKFKIEISEFNIEGTNSDYEEFKFYILEAKLNEPIVYKECQLISLLHAA